MNSQELFTKLTPVSGMLTISADTLGQSFGSFLDFYYAGQAITLSGAQLSREPQADGAIVYTGTSSFGPVANLPTVARFSVDATGQVAVELRYKVRGAVTQVNPWVFSRSFPDLPTEVNHLTGKAEVMLDTLDLYDSSFVVVTAAGTDRELGAPLLPGINFVSHLRPSGLLGVFEHIAKSDPTTVIYGVIIPPKPSDLVVELKPLEHAWDRLGSTSPPPPAGIYLQAALDLNFSVGKLSLSKTQLRTYTPISNAWMGKYPGFLHKQGYTATLAIPSANIEVNLGADMRLGIPVAMLYGNCQGVSLGKLEHLLDLAGTDGLLSNLPDELRKPVAALEKLELMQVGLDLVLSGLMPTLRSVSITVGFPSLKWHVWDDDLVVESLSCRFVIFDPFTASPLTTRVPTVTTPTTRPGLPISVTVNGILDVEGVPVSVTAGSDEGFLVRANTLAPANLPLDKLVKKHGAGVPLPTPLTINYLQVLVWYGKAYAMEALLAGDPKPWTIPVGKQALTISNVSLYFLKQANTPITGRMSGKIEFLKGVTLQVTYDIPGSLIIRSTLPPMRLSHVIDQLCNKAVKLPSGFDFDLDYALILIQEQQQAGTFLFQMCAQIDGLGVLAFEARKAGDGQWGFAYGIEILSAPSKVGGLSALAALEKALHLRKFLVVASSLDQPGFQLPDTAQFNHPVLATKKVALPGSGGVAAGLNIFAEWGLDSSDKQQKLLKTLLGLGDTQQVTIQVGENPSNSKLFFSNAGKLQGHPFQYKLGMQLNNGQPSLFLTGSMTLEIQKQPQTFDVTTLFVPNGAFLSATMKGVKPVNLGPFSVSNLAVEIGVDWAGLPSLGLTGNIDVKSFESSIAIFFDSANPTQSLVAGAVSDLTLAEVVDTLLGTRLSSSIDEVLSSVAVQGTNEFAISGELSDELDQLKLPEIAAAFLSAGKLTVPSTSSQVLLCVNKAGEAWHLTDLTKMRHYQLKKKDKQILVSTEAQFYFAPQATSIGTIAFPQGYYISGAIKFLGWKAQATIEIAANKSISVEAEMDKISLGPKGLFTISAASGGGGPKVSISTMAQPQNPVAEYRNPHFYVNGAVQLFGIQEKVLASLSTKGLLLDIKGALAPGAEFDLGVVVGGTGLSVDGDIKVGIGTIDLGPLGKVKVNTDVEGGLGIRVNGQEVSLAVEASFEFLGEEQKLGKFSIESKPDALKSLASTIEKKVEAHLTDMFKDVGHWTNALKNGALDGVDDASKVLIKHFGKSEKEAQELAKSAGKDAKVAEKAVAKTASKFGKKLKKIF